MKPNAFVFKFFCILAFLGLLCAAGSIPFYFESPSMYYKTGIEKLMLRTGKILGIIGGLLMIFQLIFVGRFPMLDRHFSMKTLFSFHRLNGLILLICAIIHPILILGADHFVFFPVEKKYWPEIVGGVLLSVLSVFVSISFFQKKIGLRYPAWKMLHKTFAPVLLVMLFVHVFNVSRTFESGLPYYLLIAAAGITAFLMFRKFLMTTAFFKGDNS
jgi:hypothetical protein